MDPARPTCRGHCCTQDLCRARVHGSSGPLMSKANLCHQVLLLSPVMGLGAQRNLDSAPTFLSSSTVISFLLSKQTKPRSSVPGNSCGLRDANVHWRSRSRDHRSFPLRDDDPAQHVFVTGKRRGSGRVMIPKEFPLSRIEESA